MNQAKQQAEIDAIETAEEAKRAEVVAAYGPIWKQLVESISHGPGVWDQTDSWYAAKFACDSDADQDYVFLWNGFNASDPDSIRWATPSSRVYAAFLSFGNLSRNGYGWTYDEVRLCAGAPTVALAGGADAVRAQSWLKVR